MSRAFHYTSRLTLVVGIGSYLCGCTGEPERRPLPDNSRIVPVQATLSPPIDLLADTELISCAQYEAERCEGGKLQRCAIYDTQTQSFDDTPDALLERVLHYDRWYDLYTSPNGQAAERNFAKPMPAGTPEATWAAPENFARYTGIGDSGLYTAAALTAATFRYGQTGTQADYERMRAIVETQMRNFDITGVPGYMARFHFLMVPPGTPQTPEVIMRLKDPSAATVREMRVEPNILASMEGLPRAFTQGVPDGTGGTTKGTPMWEGHPSIDAYSGPMMAMPLAFDLLRSKDQALKDKITYHFTCYLKRLRRIDIINLKDNADLQADLTRLFGGGDSSKTSNFESLDSFVFYYHDGINRLNKDTFDRSCPDTIATTPIRILDASDPETFYMDLLELAADAISSDSTPRQIQLDHFYLPNVRGADASHMMHLSTMAYRFTGDTMYRDFLLDELIGNLNTVEVAKTMRTFRRPNWCNKFYADHITYTSHWQFIHLLGPGQLKNDMIDAMHTALWSSALKTQNSALFNIMYAGVVPQSVSSELELARNVAITQIQAMGGNGGVLDDPRRTYSIQRSDVISQLPSSVTPICPTEAQFSACEAAQTLLGVVPVPGSKISHVCDERPGECVMNNGSCTDQLADVGPPVQLRGYADFIWQPNPYTLGRVHSVDAQRQSAGIDLSQPYWMARYYGFIEEGEGSALAWRTVNDTCPVQ